MCNPTRAELTNLLEADARIPDAEIKRIIELEYQNGIIIPGKYYDKKTRI